MKTTGYRVKSSSTTTTLVYSLLALLPAGCGQPPDLLLDGGAVPKPRSRVGRYAAATIGGASYADPEDLGSHGYARTSREHNGILYTCKGGHIDIAHVRKAADWTAYLVARTHATIKQEGTQFSYKPPEPSRHFITLKYPADWSNLTEQEQDRTAREVSLAIGQYLAFASLAWHEMLTWFGWSTVAIYPDFPSAFSWEDTYSDLLGTHIGILALRDTDDTYDRAVTRILNQELERLGIQPKATAIRASQEARGHWYSGDFLFFINMKKRNFDIGLDDGFVTPWIVPTIEACAGSKPLPLAVPTLDVLTEHGFEMKFEIEPKVLQTDEILRVAYPDAKEQRKRIEPAVHFRRIMEHIKADAVKRYGPDVDVPWPRPDGS